MEFTAQKCSVFGLEGVVIDDKEHELFKAVDAVDLEGKPVKIRQSCGRETVESLAWRKDRLLSEIAELDAQIEAIAACGKG